MPTAHLHADVVHGRSTQNGCETSRDALVASEAAPTTAWIDDTAQVEGVSDSERDDAWSRIKKAAKKHGVEVHEKSWHELGKKKS